DADEGRTSFASRAREAHGFGATRWRIEAGEDDESEPATAENLFGGPERVDPRFGTQQHRPRLPRMSGHGVRAVDPGRAFAGGDDRRTGGAEQGRGPAERRPYREPSPRKTYARQNTIERRDARRDLLG